jgi:ferric-dicitrate binding protein FerR (iron transport regulator)
MERALALVPRPAPRPEFLRDLRTQFMNVAAAQTAAPTHAARPKRTQARTRIPVWAIAAGILAVAASALAVFALRGPGGARWTPVDGRTPRSPLIVDGRSVAPHELADAIADPAVAHTIITGPEGLWLWLDGSVCCEIAPDSEVEVGPIPRDGASLVIVARKGTLRACTADQFVGSRMDVKTPQLDLVVTGTAFAIDIEEDGTCVCCLEGQVVMKPLRPGEKPWAVDSGRMCRIYSDQRAPRWDEMNATHRGPLEQFDEEADELMN